MALISQTMIPFYLGLSAWQTHYFSFCVPSSPPSKEGSAEPGGSFFIMPFSQGRASHDSRNWGTSIDTRIPALCEQLSVRLDLSVRWNMSLQYTV